MKFKDALFRLKRLDNNEKSEFKKCLSLFSLTLLGIGSTLGLGVYVLIGDVASKAGPAILFSFLIATFASFFSGLCYAEFGARVPKAGSAYVYSYASVGEVVAFVIGWNLILEYAIGTSSVAKGFSLYIDSLFGNKVVKFMEQYFSLNLGSKFSEYFDILAFGITLLLTFLLCLGVKKSTMFNSFFTVLNILIVIFATMVGSFKINFENWNLPKSEVGPNGGEGGFFPFGLQGILKTSATCFFFFVGFDCICTSSEETKNPSKTIPLSIIFCLISVSLAYISISSVQTLMWPYYDPLFLTEIFGHLNLNVAKWILIIGTLAGLSSSMLGSIFPLPRILYSMASDGLLYRFLCKINKKTKIPLLSTLLSGFLAAITSAIFNLKELADMMSIGTLLAYTLVSLSVLILRYRKQEAKEISDDTEEDYYNYMYLYSFRNLLNLDGLTSPTVKTSYISCKLILILSFLIFSLCGSITFQISSLNSYDKFALANVFVILILIIFFYICLRLQPKNLKSLLFEVPFVPSIPLISVFSNILLMMNLSEQTWLRFVIWMIIGFVIYFTYGIKNSTGHMSDDEKKKFLITESNENSNTTGHDNLSYAS